MTGAIKCILLGSHLLFTGETAVIVPHGWTVDQYTFESCEACKPVKEKIQYESAWHWSCTPVTDSTYAKPKADKTVYHPVKI